jgi:hypothetical protein
MLSIWTLIFSISAKNRDKSLSVLPLPAICTLLLLLLLLCPVSRSTSYKPPPALLPEVLSANRSFMARRWT